ncbi:MAG: glutamine-hydrolyzing carbamoyl-phosphate synthase small subunit [Treponema sp.]|nr:glutamine-hydrolyzing carbamoyl-phosphate synthase small subunit [Treponema sp.]
MKAWLILADGTIFQGTPIGATGTTIGETVFTTGMTGYIETLTDPSYYGQIVTQTFPLMGNYGIIPQDYESKKCWVRGYIVREICELPSNFRCQKTLNNFLKEQNIIGICGIDTRALTKRLRESGVMNGMIITSETEPSVTPELLQKIKEYKIEQAVETVSIKEGEASPSVQPAAQSSPTPSAGTGCPRNAPAHIILWDFGAKANIQRELEKRGCNVTVVPCETTAEQILSMNPDGIMLSNGPGDPADNIGIIQEIRKICEHNARQPMDPSTGSGTVPIFGICLGHQMLALARGCKTSKLKYGHRGGNHPVKDTATGRVYITSQNHGYAVETDTLPNFATLSFYNVNDETCEGITYTDIPAFSVQFHPEACGGPHDTNFLFDNFMAKIKEVKDASK